MNDNNEDSTPSPGPPIFTQDSEINSKYLETYSRILEEQSRRKWTRSTLSLKSALEMRPYIISLINEPKAICIPYSAFPRCTPRTVYVKFHDAIRWFIERDPTIDESLRNAIAYLKTIIKIERGTQGILVTPVTLGRAIRPGRKLEEVEQAIEHANQTKATSQWKNQFIEWMSSGDSSVPFSKKGLVLNSDDMTWLRKICEQNDWPVRVTMHEVFVTKEG